MKNKLILLCCTFMFLAACGPFNEYTQNAAIDNATWPAGKVYRFEYLSKDTLLEKDFSVNLRHTGLYKYNNIYLFVTIIAPNGKSVKDTAEFTLADTKGKWAGKGLGDIFDVRLAYKHNVRFGQEGNYTFLIEHGMRDLQLKEVTDIGICISKINQ